MFFETIFTLESFETNVTIWNDLFQKNPVCFKRFQQNKTKLCYWYVAVLLQKIMSCSSRIILVSYACKVKVFWFVLDYFFQKYFGLYSTIFSKSIFGFLFLDIYKCPISGNGKKSWKNRFWKITCDHNALNLEK